MVKRIFLISLFLFMPFVANVNAFAEEATVVYGEDVDTRNIHLDLDRMDYALEETFGKKENFSDVQDAFYTEFSNVISQTTLFSVRDLFESCLNTVKDIEGCQSFVGLYMEIIPYPRKLLFSY